MSELCEVCRYQMIPRFADGVYLFKAAAKRDTYNDGPAFNIYERHGAALRLFARVAFENMGIVPKQNELARNAIKIFVTALDEAAAKEKKRTTKPESAAA